MACERCGAQVASDVCRMRATFTTPSGSPLHLDILIQGSSSGLATAPAFFCEACWISFLEMFKEISLANRVTRGQAEAS